MKLNEFMYYVKYGISTFLFGGRAPMIAGMPLTDVCNLRCAHCVVANTGRGHYSFSRIREIFMEFYGKGARILFLQGGEIMTWFDGVRTASDVINEARNIGFFKVAAVTNGTFPINLSSDAVWVSMDGPEIYHDAIRGAGVYRTVMENIRNSSHPNIAVNLTVNRMNRDGVEAFVTQAGAEPKIRGISVNFHTPYPGVENLALSMEERRQTANKLLALKKKGCHILNSNRGLKALASGKYKRPVHIIHLMEKDRIFECCWGREHKGVCEKCGYGIIPELAAIESMNPAAIIDAFGLFRAVKK